MSRFTRIFVGLSVAFLIVYMGKLDSLLFARYTDGVLTQVQSRSVTKKLSRSQIEYTFLTPDIRYEFVVDGRKYSGSSPYLEFQGWNDSAETRVFLSQFYVGKMHRVWYDSRDPSFSWLMWHSTPFFGVLIAILGGGLAISGLPLPWDKIVKKTPLRSL